MSEMINTDSIQKRHKIIFLIPAGRRRYLKILFSYLEKDKFIDEIWIFDNCRDPADRNFLNNFIKQKIISDSRWKLFNIPKADGTNRSVNKIYKFIESYNDNAFFVKIDDDIVYIDRDFSKKFYQRALSYVDDCYLFSPVVINNALISFFLIIENKIKIGTVPFSAQASDLTLWRSGLFAEYLHRSFLESLKRGRIDNYYLNKVYKISNQRFSINCIGFFSELIELLNDKKIPLMVQNADDEEYLTSILSAKLEKKICIINDVLVSHFSFFTQEYYLVKQLDILQDYARIAGIELYKDELKINYNRVSCIKAILKSFIKDLINIGFGIYLKSQKEKFYRMISNQYENE